MLFNCEGLAQGGADCLTRRAHFGLVFLLPVEGSGLAPGLSQRKLIADPCGTMFTPRHPPSTKLPSLGPLPRFVLCHQTTIRWSVSSAGRAVVVSRPRCLCHCLPMFVRHTSSKEIARCKSVRSGRVCTSHDPTALAVFFLQSGSSLQIRKFSQTDRGKQRDIGVNRCTRHMW